MSDIDCRTFETWYGIVLLISNRLRVNDLYRVEFPQSKMGRYLIFADIRMNAHEILRIGTVHLESLSSPSERTEQLSICQKAFDEGSRSSQILMGDFNFTDENDENEKNFELLRDWIDTWTCLVEPNEYRYTADTEVNLMRQRNKSHHSRLRYDRIIVRSKTIKPKKIEILGKNVIGHIMEFPVFISDHFGLMADFALDQE